ncbi:MAG: FIG00388424: hypothetical protein [uncultured Sulfurovum sp.]|uniref:Cysteine-rich small domain-containing protein n=1 Tax=uncultured Sulfurovum sp. TaxID=269237 RepID=A0A6S6THG8_9BACT|nr:MAG: FIG00388424: hypothetical protein [uncultured Sulfurovum sp.]
MTYKNWFQAHGEKHKAIMTKLSHLNDEEVIAYFRFENMVINEPDFCLLYKENKKCHDIEQLNCYLCACPYFRFNDKGVEKVKNKTLYSTCSIESKDGSQFIDEQSIHQDCTGCGVPHHESYIQKNFSRDWFEIMKDVQA